MASMVHFPTRHKAHVHGELIEYVVAGQDGPVIVLINGSGGTIEAWHKVFRPLSELAITFAYDRPGVAGGSKPAVVQTASHMVASLYALLRAAGQRPPYVLVGHSLGGLIANLFARLHPALVESVVLIEATSPDDPVALQKHENGAQRLIRVVLDKVAPLHPHSETLHINASVRELLDAPAFPNVPLIVVSGSKPAMAWATAPQALSVRAANQKKLLGLSTLSKQVMATNSGHFPQFSEPDVVVAAIKEAVDWHSRRRGA